MRAGLRWKKAKLVGIYDKHIIRVSFIKFQVSTIDLK